jgi:hypothetical protein
VVYLLFIYTLTHTTIVLYCYVSLAYRFLDATQVVCMAHNDAAQEQPEAASLLIRSEGVH